MKITITTLALLLNTISSAQHDIGIGFDFGVSRLYSTDSSVGTKYNFFPSGNIGAFYRYKPENSKSNFLVELMVSQIEGMFYSEMPIVDENFSVVGKSKTHTYYHITSFSLPAYYGLQFNKFGLLFGAEIAIPIFSGYNSRNNKTYYDVNKTTKVNGSPLYIDPINFYGRIGFEWIISHKLLLIASYSQGLNTITKENGAPWKTLQASLGLRYKLTKKQ